MTRIKRFPEYMEAKIEDTEEGPWPKVTRITEIRCQIYDYPFAYSDNEFCMYVREDIVKDMVHALENAGSLLEMIANNEERKPFAKARSTATYREIANEIKRAIARWKRL